jgi:predicted RecA/RadA family phage recombinase
MKTNIPLMLASSIALTFVALAQAGDTSALAVFTGPKCTADEIKTLRDQVGCVDSQIPASSAERRSFDEVATHYLGEVDAGRMDENAARQQINVALRQAAAANAPSTAQQNDDFKAPRGYRKKMQDGEIRYCRNEATETSRAAKVEVCLTKEELIAEQAGDSSAAERAHEAAGAGIYGKPSTTGGNAPSPQ